jgi:hypothetical protein
VRSRSSLATNLRVSSKLTQKTELALDVSNLFDRQVNDMGYFYESKLRGEAAPLADPHVHWPSRGRSG